MAVHCGSLTVNETVEHVGVLERIVYNPVRSDRLRGPAGWQRPGPVVPWSSGRNPFRRLGNALGFCLQPLLQA